MPRKSIRYKGATYQLVKVANYDLETSPLYYYFFEVQPEGKKAYTAIGVVAKDPDLAQKEAQAAFRSFENLYTDEVEAGNVRHSTKATKVSLDQLRDILDELDYGDIWAGLAHIENQFAQQGWAYTEIP